MLIGKNVELRCLTEEHHPLLLEWLNTPEFWGSFFNIWPMSMSGVKHLLDEHRDGAWYIIYSRAEDKPVGIAVSFHPYAGYGDTYFGQEIGYMIHPGGRGRGVASQAAALLINHLFDATQVERIIASVVVGNMASCRVLEKAGMTLEGVERRKTFLHGVFRDMRLYSIIRDDWVNEQEYRKGRDF